MPYLYDYGVHLVPLPFYSEDTYAQIANAGISTKVSKILMGSLCRILESKEVRRANVLWIHRFAAPVGTGLIASMAKGILKRPLVYSYDDAMYIKRGKPSWLRDWFGSWQDINTVIAKSDYVLAWNRELQAHAQHYGKRVRLLSSAIDTVHYAKLCQKKIARRGGSTFRVGWIGTPATARYLDLIHPVLSALAQEGPLEIRLIGGDMADVPGATLSKIPWQEETEVQELCQVDVGIAPLPDNPWTRGKSGLKLVQYMGCGLPVVASAVGAHMDLIQDGVQGFLVTSQQAWLDALRSLRDNQGLRQTMGEAGFQTAQKKHDFSVVAEAVADVCKQLG